MHITYALSHQPGFNIFFSNQKLIFDTQIDNNNKKNKVIFPKFCCFEKLYILSLVQFHSTDNEIQLLKIKELEDIQYNETTFYAICYKVEMILFIIIRILALLKLH